MLRRDAAAQLQVWRDDVLELDVQHGCGPDDLFWIFSASKPFIGVLVWQLIERGQLGLDDPVSAYWPEFAQGGKQHITVRQILTHRSGLPVASSGPGDVLAMRDWHRSIRRIERARPRYEPGTDPAYQYVIYGFMLGELVQRVTGLPLRRVMDAELLRPLDLTDTRLGLRTVEVPRAVPITTSGQAGRIADRLLNASTTRRAVIPAAGISTTAADLATFYRMLLAGGSLDGGPRILQPATIERMRAPSASTERDRFARSHVRWAHGFQLGGSRPGPKEINPMGQLSSRSTFGHNGSNCCIGWADPERGLVFAYLTNRFTLGRRDIAHLAAVADAVIAAADAS